MDRTLSGVTTPSQSDCIQGVLCNPQSSSITEASPSDCFVSYREHSFGESYPSAELQLVLFYSPIDWANTPGESASCIIVELNSITILKFIHLDYIIKVIVLLKLLL